MKKMSALQIMSVDNRRIEELIQKEESLNVREMLFNRYITLEKILCVFD